MDFREDQVLRAFQVTLVSMVCRVKKDPLDHLRRLDQEEIRVELD